MRLGWPNEHLHRPDLGNDLVFWLLALSLLSMTLQGCILPDYVEVQGWKGTTSGTALGDPGGDYAFGLDNHAVAVVLGYRITPTKVVIHNPPRAAEPVPFDVDPIGPIYGPELPPAADDNSPLKPVHITALSAALMAVLEVLRRVGWLGSVAQGIGKVRGPET